MKSLKKVNNWVHAVSDDQGLIRDAIKKKPEMGPTEAQLSSILSRLNTPACHSMVGYLIQRIAVHPNKKVHWRTMLKGLRIISYALERGNKEVFDEVSNYKSYFEQITATYQYFNRLNQDKGAEVKAKSAKIVEYLNDPHALNLEKSKNRMNDSNWDDSGYQTKDTSFNRFENSRFDDRENVPSDRFRDDGYVRGANASSNYASEHEDRGPRIRNPGNHEMAARNEAWNSSGWGTIDNSEQPRKTEDSVEEKGPTITASDFFGVKAEAVKKSQSPSVTASSSNDPFAAFGSESKAQAKQSEQSVELETKKEPEEDVKSSQNIHSELDDLLGLSTPKSQVATKKDTLDDLFSEPQSSTIVTNPFEDEPTPVQTTAKSVSVPKKTTTDDIWNF